MVYTFKLTVLLCGCLSLSGIVQAGAPVQSEFLEWSDLPPLPPADGQAVNPGLAGAYAGIVSNSLIIAGGANFRTPVTEITNGAPKIYHDTVYRMTDTGGEFAYAPVTGALPFPLAYGADLTLPRGVLVIGGHNAGESSADVLLLTLSGERLDVAALPPLPQPLTCAKAVLLGGRVYLAGGSTSASDADASASFLSFDLALLDHPDFAQKCAAATELLALPSAAERAERGRALWGPQFRWQSLPDIPGEPRTYAMLSVQHDGLSPNIYLMGGRRKLAESEIAGLSDDARAALIGGSLRFFDEVLKFNPAERQWKACAALPVPLSAGVSAPWGQSHIFVLSGSDGTHVPAWEQQKFLYRHPGFVSTPLIYHAITDTWIADRPAPHSEVTAQAVAAQLGLSALPEDYPVPTAQVTAAVTAWNGAIILVSGEVRPGVRTPAVRRITVKPLSASFGFINYATLALYLLAMVGVGIYFSGRNRSTDDFFRGGQHIPWWAAACSIYATMLSSITFVALPAKAFAADWSTWVMQIMILPVSLFVIWKILPFFRRIDATSAYEYLELRFNYAARAAGSLLFILFQIGRMAVVMYLPALALQAITGLSPVACILIMGVLSIVYCTMGGIEAVIWTDTIQTFVLLGGALLSVAIIILNIDGGFATFLADCTAAGKFKVVNWDFSAGSYMTLSIWVVILGGIFQNLASYSADQAVVQRYMTTPDIRRAANSILMNGIMCVPAGLIFFVVGAALFSFYKNNPAAMTPAFEPKSVFPLFIATHMPVGISGVVVAGIFAAAQSTLSTSMNSLSTTLVTDFARPMNACRTEAGYLTLARIFTALLGVAGTAAAVLIACSDIYDVFDHYLAILGLFMGVLAGMFFLGMFSKVANAAGTIAAAALCALFMCWLKFFSGSAVHSFLYPAISLTLTYLLGLLLSLLTGGRSNTIDGLTVFRQ